MHSRAVVVTGVGAIAAIGRTASEFWQSLTACRSGIRPIEAVDRSRLQSPNGAEVRGFDPRAHFDRQQLRSMDRFTQFAVVAARDAVADADLTWTADLRRQTAIVMGSCVGGRTSEDLAMRTLYRNEGRIRPLSIAQAMANSASSHMSMEFGVTGPAFTLSTACASSNHAIGQAMGMIRSGQVEVALAGGSEAPFSLGHLKAWDEMRVMSPDTCRPFSIDRRGMVLGEGGAVVVLESAERARGRGARVYAEIAGAGYSSDAHHVTKPSAEGQALAMTQALADARSNPADIGYVNAHGTGTAISDRVEACAIRRVFGDHTDRLAVSSTKSMHGHALGAAGALEAVATILALHHGQIPPTANFLAADPACNLDVVPNRSRAATFDMALSNGFGFGGTNAVVVFRRWSGR